MVAAPLRIWEHGKRNFALREAGLMPIVCPVADANTTTGVAIFDATPEEVERIMSRDPGVMAGILTYDVHATSSFPGSSLVVERARIAPAAGTSLVLGLPVGRLATAEATASAHERDTFVPHSSRERPGDVKK